MSGVLPDLKANLVLDDTSFKITASRAGVTLGSLVQRFDEVARVAARTDAAINRFGGGFRQTIITLGAFKFLLMDIDSMLLAMPRSIAKTAGELQKMQMTMEGLSESSQIAKQRLEGLMGMNFVIGMAKNSPFEVKALADSFIKLKSAGLDPAAGSMQALVDSVAKFGGTSETLKRASVAIQQMSGKGVISMEELRQQLGEAIPNAMQLMAQGMGLSVAELTEKVSKGIVKSKTALARLFLQMQLDAAGAAEKMMNTLPGALSQLTTEWTLFQKLVADQGFIQTLVSGMRELTVALKSPEGQQFAKDVGNALRSMTEFLMLSARWLATNIDLVKNFATAMLSLWGGAKLLNAFNGIKGRMANMIAQRQRIADVANAATERERVALSRLANQQQQALQQMEARRDQAARRAQERLDRARTSNQAALEKEQKNYQALMKRKEDLQQEADARADARRDKNIAEQQRKAEAARKRVEGLTGTISTLKATSVEQDKAKTEALERKREQQIERINKKSAASADQLAELQTRRADLVAQRQQDNETKLRDLAERRADREAQLDAKRESAQRRLNQLEQQRQQLMDRAKNNAVKSIEANTVAQAKRLAQLQGEILSAQSSNITDAQRADRLNSLRSEETAKRASYDREIAHLNQVRTLRTQMEEIYQRDLGKSDGPIKNSSGQFVSPTSEAGIEAIKKRDAARLSDIASAREQETRLAANARGYKAEEQAAQTAADALTKHKNVSDEDLRSMQQRATALESEIAHQKKLVEQIKQSGLTTEQYTAKVRAQLDQSNQQIAAQKQVIAGIETERNALAGQFEERSKLIAANEANTRSIDNQISKKRREITLMQDEVRALRETTAAKGAASVASQARLATLEADLNAAQRAVVAHEQEAQALRTSTAEHTRERNAIAGKIDTINRNADASRQHTAELLKNNRALQASIPAGDAYTLGLNRQAEALQRALNHTRSLHAANVMIPPVISAAGSALAGFGRTLASSMGFAIAFYAAIEGGMWLFDKLTQKTRNAEAAQQALNRARAGMPAPGDPDKLRTEIKDNQDKIRMLADPGITNALAANGRTLQEATEKAAQLQAQLDKLGTNDAGRAALEKEIKEQLRRAHVARRNIAGFEADIKALQAKNVELGVQVTNAESKLQGDKEAQDVSAALERINNNTTARLRERDEMKKYQKLKEEILAMKKAGKSDTEIDKYATEQRKKLGEDYNKAQLGEFDAAVKQEMAQFEITRQSAIAQIEALRKQGKTAEADRMQNQFRSQEAAMAAAIKDARDSKMRMIDAASDTNFYQASTKDKGPKDTWLDNFIESQREKSVDLLESSRKLAEGMVDAASIRRLAEEKVMAMVKRGDGGVTLKKDGAKIKTAIDMLAQNLTDGETNKVVKQLDDLKIKVEASMDRLADSFDGDPSKVRKNALLEEVNRTIGELRARQSLLKDYLKDRGQNFEEFANTLRKGAMDAPLAELIAELDKTTRGLADEAETDEAARQERITQNRIENVRRRVMAEIAAKETVGKLNEQDTAKLEQLLRNFNAFYEAEMKALAQKTKSPIQHMVDDWAKGMQHMREASVNWANSFVDQLVEGTFKFGEFVQSILKDIAKIKMREVLSEGIGGLLENAVQGIGSMIGLQSTKTTKSNTYMPDGSLRVWQTNGAAASAVEVITGNTGPTEKNWGQQARDLMTQMWEGLTRVPQAITATMERVMLNVETAFTGIGAWIGDLFSNIGQWITQAFQGLSESGAFEGMGTAIASFFAFANGGIMTNKGSIALRKYAKGGIADSPQLAMFGEGSRPEAFVPLPDGRTIPVTMNATKQGPAEPPAAPQLTLNVINQSGTQMEAKQGGMRFDGKSWVQDVILTGMSQPGPFRDNMRNMLNKN